MTFRRLFRTLLIPIGRGKYSSVQVSSSKFPVTRKISFVFESGITFCASSGNKLTRKSKCFAIALLLVLLSTWFRPQDDFGAWLITRSEYFSLTRVLLSAKSHPFPKTDKMWEEFSLWPSIICVNSVVLCHRSVITRLCAR